MDRPLGTCDDKQYEPNMRGDMYVPGLLVPRSVGSDSRMVSELSMPQVLIRGGPYDCHENAANDAWNRSPLLFNNATKQQKYNQNFPTKKIASR